MTDGRTIQSTEIHRIKIVTADTCDTDGNLSLGHLLKWMDATSCMSAERLAKRCCVTLLMDDLNFTQGVNVKQGHRVYLDACVTKAWGSSCEVRVNAVCATHPGGRITRQFADVRFVYVILKTEKEIAEKIKVRLPKLNIDAMNFYQKKEWELAEKRKHFRRNRGKLIEKMSMSLPELPPQPQLNLGQSMFVRKSASPSLPMKSEASRLVQMWELVLPLHANHMGNTFGGQIMLWMSKVAFETAWKFVGYDNRHKFIPVCIDQVLFLAPSHVGDRLQFVAKVTRVFKTSLEVKVSVFGGNVTSNDSKLINEAFVTYVYASGDDDKVWIGKEIESCEDLIENEEYSPALGRRALRLQRLAMQNLLRTFKDLDESQDGLLSKQELLHALTSSVVVKRCIQRRGFNSEAFLKHLLASVTTDKGVDFEAYNNAVETFFEKTDE